MDHGLRQAKSFLLELCEAVAQQRLERRADVDIGVTAQVDLVECIAGVVQHIVKLTPAVGERALRSRLGRDIADQTDSAAGRCPSIGQRNNRERNIGRGPILPHGEQHVIRDWRVRA